MHGMNGNASKPCQKPATFASWDLAGFGSGRVESIEKLYGSVDSVQAEIRLSNWYSIK